MKRKVLITALVFVFAISALAGCGTASNNSATSTQGKTSLQSTAQGTTEPAENYGDTGGIKLPISKENITIKALMNMENDTPLADTFFIKEVEKRTNIKIVFENLNPGDWNEKKSILIASKNLPDLIAGQGILSNEKLGLDSFACLTDNLDILPNFKKILDEKPAISKALAQSDGKLYEFPHLSYLMGPAINYGMIYRKDIFDKNGLSAPKGPDEYYNALKKLKEVYPDSIPFINYYQIDLSLFAQGWGVTSSFCLPEGSDKMVFGPATDEWKEFLKYFNKLYKEKLIDPEFFTCSEEDFSAKALQETKSFVFRGWFGRMDTLANQIKDKIPTFDLEAAYPIGPKGTIYKEGEFLDYGTSVSASSKYKNEVLQLFDYCLSPSGMELCSMGKEGETYNVGSDGSIKYIGYEDKNPTRNELSKSFGIAINGMLYAADPRSVFMTLSPKFQAANDLLKDTAVTKEPQPMLTFTEAENKELSPIFDSISKTCVEWATKFIMGKESIDEKWDAYIKLLEKGGLEKATELQNAAYARYLK